MAQVSLDRTDYICVILCIAIFMHRSIKVLSFYYRREGSPFLPGRRFEQHSRSDLFLYSKTEIEPFLILPHIQKDNSNDHDDYIDDSKPMIMLEILIWRLLHVTENRQLSLPHSPASFL